MKRALIGLVALALSAPTAADVTGFVQTRYAQRLHSLDECALESCAAVVEETLGELLVDERPTESLAWSLRTEAAYDDAVSDVRIAIREGFLAWTPAADLDFKVGRQVLTWGVSDYLYVNDIFPKNYDAFFTGGGFDRMKEPVDAARAAWYGAAADVEAVVSRWEPDRIPSLERFSATASADWIPPGDDPRNAFEVALRVATHRGGWDLAAYAAEFRSRERRYFVHHTGPHFDHPRLQHLGVSLTGNAAGGVVWLEAAHRLTKDRQNNVVSRYALGRSVKLIAGYSREVAQDVTASAQLQLEAATAHDRYRASLAPGVQPLERVSATLHLRLQARWINQTLSAGSQLFVENEGDAYFNPFLLWSPADGWTMEAGMNLFEGESDSRYGALRKDSNAYILVRYSF